MQKIVLSCKQATFFSSVKGYVKLKKLVRLQHKLHLMICPGCKEFDRQSELIDKTLNDLHQNEHYLSKELLSTEKKSKIKSTVNQHLN